MMKMRFAWCAACLLVAYDCALKALGEDPQFIFTTDMVWLWWLPAAWWLATALCTLVVKVSMQVTHEADR